MCGVFGVIHSKSLDRKVALALNGFLDDAARVGIVRGEDSAGLFQIRNSKELKVIKVPYNGYLMASDPKARQILGNSDISSVTIGHHRAATKGVISAANAHPFEHKVQDGYIIGVHNGYISNSRWSEDNIDFSVDSDWGLYQIAKKGAEEGVGSLEGAMALVWYNSTDSLLRLFTNGKRALHWNYVKGHDAMIICSEHEMLYWLASRNDIEIENTMWTGKEDTIYSFDPEDPRAFDSSVIVVPEKKEYKREDYRPYGLWDGYPSAAADTVALPSEKESSLRTFQGEAISYDAADIEKMRYARGEIVDFCPESSVETASVTNIVGQVLKDDNGTIDVTAAIIVGSNKVMKENIAALTSNFGECKCRVIGTSVLNGPDGPVKCLVLAKPTALIISEEKKDKKESTKSLELDVPIYEGVLVSEARFNEIVKDGCAGCTASLIPRDAKTGKITWVDKQPYCAGCADPKSLLLEVSGGVH